MISDCHLFFIFFLAGPKEPLESTFKDVSEFLLNETSPPPPLKIFFFFFKFIRRSGHFNFKETTVFCFSWLQKKKKEEELLVKYYS